MNLIPKVLDEYTKSYPLLQFAEHIVLIYIGHLLCLKPFVRNWVMTENYERHCPYFSMTVNKLGCGYKYSTFQDCD